MMLDESRIAEVTADIAGSKLSDVHLRRVLSEEITDSQGEDALRITLVFDPDEMRRITGEEALDFLVAIQEKLSSEGEERFSMIEYATEQELAADPREDDA